MTLEPKGEESMSHVDDGSLHAYLDGELSAVERTRLEAHLGECPSCRARLDEERALIERAGQLLGLATPPGPERAMPPLHQLRHPRPRLRGMVPLAWAATVVLAVWVGWYARGGPSAPGIQTALEAPGDSTMYYLRDPFIPAAEPAPASATPASRAGGPAQGTTGGRAPAREETARDQLARTERDDRAADALASQVAPARAEPSVGAGVVPAASPPPVLAPMAQGAVGIESRVMVEAKAISTDSARRVLGGSLALVPGLPVKSIRYLAGGPVEIDQQLDSATVITLYEWPTTVEAATQQRALERRRPAAPTAAAPSAPSANVAKASESVSERLARYVRGLRVEVSGRVPVDSLNKLLQRVQ